MTKKVTITDHVERFVAMKQKLGYEFTRDAQLLRRFARFADDRNETFIRSETAVECVHRHQQRDRSPSESECCTRCMPLLAVCTPRMPATKCRLVMFWAICPDGGRGRI